MNGSTYAILGFVVGSVILWGYAVSIYITSRKINRRYQRYIQSSGR